VVKKLLSDIRFWLVLFFLIRIIGITYPPIENTHSWRQCLTASIARNYLEENADIRFPAQDVRDKTTGIIPAEFPVFSYLIFILVKIFGYGHWYGRLLNLLVTSVGIYFFYRAISLRYGERTGFYAALMLTISIWFIFGRKIMPDTFSASLALTGYYFAELFIARRKIIFLFAMSLFLTLGIMTKLPSVVFLVFLVPIFLDKQVSSRQKFSVIMGCIPGVFFTWLWYFWWNPHLAATFGNQLYFPYSFSEGFRYFGIYWKEVCTQFTFIAFEGFIGSALCIAGIIMAIMKRQQIVLLTFFCAFLLFGYIVVRSGPTFAMHSYYMVPFIPFMAMLGGYFIAGLKKKMIAMAATGIMIVESFLNQQHDLRYNSNQAYWLQMET
jgi:4-amino-4-deoxy-L-arabinose transferase-like glycosyltransferase